MNLVISLASLGSDVLICKWESKISSLVSALKSQNVFKYIFPSHGIFGLAHQYRFTGEMCPLIFTLVTNILAWWWWFSCYVMFDSCDPMNCSLPGSSVPGILQARILEWVAISFSSISSRPRNRTHSPASQADSLLTELWGKPKIFAQIFPILFYDICVDFPIFLSVHFLLSLWLNAFHFFPNFIPFFISLEVIPLMWSDFVKFQNICSKNLITYLFPQIQVFRIMSFILSHFT